MAVSDTKLRNAKPTKKRYQISVGESTILEIMPSGLKSWRLRYLKPDTKKPAFFTLGHYPEMGQVDARAKARQAKELVRQGIDPKEHHHKHLQELKQKKAVSELTFETVTRQWHEDRFKAGKWEQAHATRIIRSFEYNIFPRIGSLPIAEIDAPLLLEVMQPVIDRGAIETSKKLSQRLGAVFRYAIVRKLVKTNPADYISDELPAVDVKHHPHLKPEQIPEFIDAVKNSLAGERVRLAILITMHTLTRTSETRFAQWHEFDLEGKAWSIPSDRMKMGRPHTVPLSNQVVTMLERLLSLGRDEGYLFTTNAKHKPMSENAMLNVIYKAGYKGIVTIHGLRGTGSTILNEHKFRHDVIETALAHVDPNKIRGAYNHAEYFDERRRMMQYYSDYLDSLCSGTDVIPINRKQV